MSSYYRIQLEDWLKTLDIKSTRVLDVGGSQNPVKGRTKSWKVGDYKILDLEAPHEGESPDIILDLNHRYAPKELMEKPVFNMLFCLEVMEYIYDPIGALRNLYWLSMPGATLYISFPFVYPIHEPKESDMMRYTRYGAMRVLKESGWETQEVVPRLSTHGNLEKYYVHEKMRMSRTYSGHQEIGYLIKAKRL